MTDLQERIARHVYRAMCWAVRGQKQPPWDMAKDTPAKTEARAVAKNILNDIKAEEKTDDQST